MCILCCVWDIKHWKKIFSYPQYSDKIYLNTFSLVLMVKVKEHYNRKCVSQSVEHVTWTHEQPTTWHKLLSRERGKGWNVLRCITSQAQKQEREEHGHISLKIMFSLQKIWFIQHQPSGKNVRDSSFEFYYYICSLILDI